jgi:hypothetical protein
MGKVDKWPDGFSQIIVIFKGGPSSHQQPEERTSLLHESFPEALDHKREQNGPDKDVNEVHAMHP